jgi:hypothetical protein
MAMSFCPFLAWLALRGRCWTADRRLRRGLPSHTACPLCVVANEIMNHLSLRCPFAISIWTMINVRLGVSLAVPNNRSCIREWWPTTVATLSKNDARTTNSLITSSLRSLWLERNARVFNNSQLPASTVLDSIVEEWHILGRL